MPFAVILGEDELAQGKVRIKELGLREGHPEKDGVLVNMSALVTEVKKRLRRKEEMEDRDAGADASGGVEGKSGGPKKGESGEGQEKGKEEVTVKDSADD